MGLALLRALIELHAVDLLGIVLTSEERFGEPAPLEAAALQTRHTLNALGLHNSEVLVQHASKRACQLETIYERAPQTGVRLVVIHSQTAVADFVSRCPHLFREKTLSTVCMGGVLPRDEDGRAVTHSDMVSKASNNPESGSEPAAVPCFELVPDPDASNNRADEAAAQFFTKQCQKLGVPMTVISRHLALACRLPRSVYDALGLYQGQGRKRVMQRRFNVGVLEATPERKASTLRVRPER